MRNTAEKKFVQPLLELRQRDAETRQEPVSLFRVREPVVRYRTLTKVKEKIKAADGIAKLFRKLVPNNVQEHFCLFCLDGSYAVVNCSRLFTGTANTTMVHPREVFQVAVLTGACAIIVAHNHPSENLTPSQQDLDLTKRLKSAGELMGIPLLDHVIVTNKSYRSAATDGWL
jgi:DNA repair protein RadC